MLGFDMTIKDGIITINAEPEEPIGWGFDVVDDDEPADQQNLF